MNHETLNKTLGAKWYPLLDGTIELIIWPDTIEHNKIPQRLRNVPLDTDGKRTIKQWVNAIKKADVCHLNPVFRYVNGDVSIWVPLLGEITQTHDYSLVTSSKALGKWYISNI